MDTVDYNTIKFEDLKIGQHLWVLSAKTLLMVAKLDDIRYEVCGPWECGVRPELCKILKLVEPPKGFEETELYFK